MVSKDLRFVEAEESVGALGGRARPQKELDLWCGWR